MKFTRLLYLLGISLVAAVGCNSEVSLDFHKEGNCWQMSQKQFERFAKKLSTADPDEAYRLIDRVYTTVDSLTAAEQDGTFIVFSDAMEQTFYQVDSPLRDDELYLRILDREARWHVIDVHGLQTCGLEEASASGQCSGQRSDRSPYKRQQL